MKSRIVLTFICSLLLLIALFALFLQPKDSNPLPNEHAAFIVQLREQADLAAAQQIEDWEARGRFVLDRLRETAERTQAPVVSVLEDLREEGRVAAFYPHYIGNVIVVYGDAHAADVVAGLTQTGYIYSVPALQPANGEGSSESEAREPAGIEWNITRIGADQVWTQYGVTGTGIVVGIADSGVDYDHPALVSMYRGNQGAGSFDHEYNWWDPSQLCDVPCNHESSVPHLSNGHGTKTTGVVLGDDGGANQIGVAPGAQWIAAFACCREVTLAEDVISALEWMLAPWQIDDLDPSHPTADPSRRPHIVNGSLGLEGGSRIFATLMDAYVAAGIFPSFAAGTIPATCGALATPGDLPLVAGTGAVNSADAINDFSGRGPVAYPEWLKTHPATGPNFVAPGRNLRSSIPGGGYGGYGGTSGATPHTSGAVALLWSAEPQLIGNIDATIEILQRTAVPLETTETCGGDYPGRIPNNTYGWGRLDVLKAVEAIWQAGTLSGTLTKSGTGTPVADAIVSARRNGITLTTQSDADGSYTLLLGQGIYTVTVEVYGHEPFMVEEIAISQGDVTSGSFTLTAKPVHILSGTVTAGDALGTGDPLNATLGLWGTSITLTIPLAGDSYSVPVAEGSYWLRVVADGFEHVNRTITITEDLVEDVTLEPTWTYYYLPSYYGCGPSFTWIDATGGTAHDAPYLSHFAIVDSSRPFTFYGVTHTVYFVDTNGHISFGQGYDLPTMVIPFEGPPNNAIFGFGAVLNPLNGAQGTIYHLFTDDDRLVVEFHEVEQFWSGNPETFEFVLDSETGAILLQYKQVSRGDVATVGVENQDGTDGVVFSYAGSKGVFAPLAVGFYPVFGPPPVAQTGVGVLGTISGTITAADTGSPLAGAVVTATTFLNTFTTRTDDLGQYDFSGICADVYQVVATAPGFLSTPERQARMRWPDDVVTVDMALAPWHEAFLPLVSTR